MVATIRWQTVHSCYIFNCCFCDAYELSLSFHGAQLQQASVPVSYTVSQVPPHGLAAPLCSGQHLPPTCSSQQQVVFSTGQHYHPVRQTQQRVWEGCGCEGFFFNCSDENTVYKKSSTKQQTIKGQKVAAASRLSRAGSFSRPLLPPCGYTLHIAGCLDCVC